MLPIAGLGVAGAAADYFSNKISNMMSKADKDGDGQLSAAEFKVAGQNVPGAQAQTGKIDRGSLFKSIDSNGDGQVTKDELKSFVDKQVQQAQSALLNIQELFSQNGAAKSQNHHRHKHHGDQQNGIQSLLGSTGKTPSVDDLFKSLDGNGDGSVSKNELTAFLEKSKSSTGASAA